jgi:hypothetical protein
MEASLETVPQGARLRPPFLLSQEFPVTRTPPGWLDATAWIAAIGFGGFAVHVDLHNDEVQATVLVLLIGGGLVGLLAPHRAWRWALVLGLSIVVGDYAAPQLHLIARAPEPINWGSLIALIPAFIGTYAGVGVRSAFATPAADR